MTSDLPHRLGRLEQAHKARDPRKSLVLIGSASDVDPRTRQPLTKAAMGPATARYCWPPSTPHFCCAFRTKMRGLANMPGSSQTSPACSTHIPELSITGEAVAAVSQPGRWLRRPRSNGCDPDCITSIPPARAALFDLTLLSSLTPP